MPALSVRGGVAVAGRRRASRGGQI